MNAIFNLTNEELKASIAEAIAWCHGQHLTTHADETEDIKKRRMLVEQAHKLRMDVPLKRGNFWNRLFRGDYRKTSEWQLAMKLSRDADADSLKPPLASQLRTHALQPNSLIGENPNENERKQLVFSVVQKRAELLRSRGQGRLPDVGEHQGEGRMLIYVPDENVSDGASEAASSGFFDLYDAPPWDVWVAYSDHTLLAWVPPQLIGLAQIEIDVNAVECIRWLE
jgi:hypothetical protein